MYRIIRYQIFWVENRCLIRKSSNRQLHLKCTKSSAIINPYQRTEIATKHKNENNKNGLNKIQRRNFSISYDSNQLINIYKIKQGNIQQYKNFKTTATDTTRNFCRVTDSKLTALYIDGLFDSFDGDHDPLGDLRNILYPEKLEHLSPEDANNDPLYLLSHATSVNNLLNTFSRIDQSALKAHHTAQAISTLRHLQKLSTMAINYLNEDESLTSQIEFNRLLMYEPVYTSILNSLKLQHSDLNINITSYVFQCLKRLEQPLSAPVMVNLEVYLRKHFNDMDSESLSYFAVSISGRTSSHSKFHGASLRKTISLAPAMPKLDKLIDEMNSPKDVHHVSICMNMMSSLISDSCMVKFYQKLNEIIKQGQFIEKSTKSNSGDSVDHSNYLQVSALVKVLSIYLTKKDWHLTRVETLRNVLYLLKGRLHLLRPDQLVIIAKVTYDLGEPAIIMYELDHRIRKLYEMQTESDIEDKEIYYMAENDENEINKHSNQKENIVSQGPDVMHDPNVRLRSYIPRVDFLHSMISSRLGKVDEKLAKNLVIESIESQLFPVYISQIFEILRNSSVGNDPLIVKEYLHRTFEVCNQDMLELCRLGTRYMNFNSSMGGIIRDRDFEMKVLTEFRKDILENPYPMEFAAQLGFMLSYSNYIGPEVLERFHFMLQQLRPFHLYNIARGLETRFMWIPRSIPTKYRSKKHHKFHKTHSSYQTWFPEKEFKWIPRYSKRSISRTYTDNDEKYNVEHEEMKKMFSAIDVALSKRSLSLFTNAANKTSAKNMVADTLPEINQLDHNNISVSKDIKDTNNNVGTSQNKYIYSAEDFPSVYLIFRNFISRRAYLDKEGFNIMIDRMVQYLEHTQLTSAVIRQIAVALSNLRPQHNLSTLLDRMVTYLLDSRKHVHTHTLLRPLHLLHQSNDSILECPKGKFKIIS